MPVLVVAERRPGRLRDVEIDPPDVHRLLLRSRRSGGGADRCGARDDDEQEGDAECVLHEVSFDSPTTFQNFTG
jgi:hypothetical protein